jgi:hypothetical protein
MIMQRISGTARAVLALFIASVLTTGAVVWAVGARGDDKATTVAAASIPERRVEADAELVMHGAYYSWLATSECVPGHHDQCMAALAQGNTALATWGLGVMEDGSVGPLDQVSGQ